jgi:tRNA G46 methylase TrmB
MRFFIKILCFFPFHLGFCIDSDVVKNCKEELARIASFASHVNSQLRPKFVRSKNYADLNSDPTDFWLQVQDNPRTFSAAIEFRIEHLKKITPQYANLLLKLETKNEITLESAKQIAKLESDSILNSILDEHSSIINFENHLLPKTNENTKSLYQKNLLKFKEAFQPILEMRKKLKERMSSVQLSLKEAKLLLEEWVLINNETDLHPDSLPDWITGADASLKGTNNYLDPQSGHQTGYGPSPLKILEKSLKRLPLSKGDTILDVGSGWGRILMSGAILHPELNFSGVEFVPERASFLTSAIERLKLPNAENMQMDASEAEIEPEIKKAKVIFLFNSFSPPALKLFIERTKSVVKNTKQTKYLIAANEHVFPFYLNDLGLEPIYKSEEKESVFNQFTIYKITP